jgi:PAS domain S-box-containing protein
LWPPKNNALFFSLVVYLSLAATAAVLVMNTGESTSVYVSLWMLISLFAGVFSFWGIVPIFIASFVFLSIQYLGNSLDFDDVTVVIFGSLIPMIVGSILWHKQRSGSHDKKSKSKSTTSELNELADKSEVIINAIGDGVMTIDSQGLIQLINPAAQEIIGWNSRDSLKLSYKSVLQLIDQENNPLDISNDPIQQVLNTNQQVRTNSLSLMTKTGKKIIISLVVSPVGDIGSGIIAVFRDITAEKAEEREQAEFISTASHEMRTPVASIEGYLGLVLGPQTAQIDDRARSYIQKAHASAQHLGRLFQELLDISKADDGRMSNKPEVVNLVTFAKDVVQGLKSKAEEKNLDLIYKPMPNDNALDKNIAPVFLVNLDNDHIREVINNLIENAIKYTPQGKIVIDITGSEDHVVMSIKDTGIGIPAEDMPHLFQKFYRVDNKDTRDIGGTGLGLYLSRRLVEMMGGRIWAESIYTKGTTFFVELPRISSQEATRLSEQENNKPQIIVETDQDLITPSPTFASSPVQPLPQKTNTPVENQPKPNTVPRGQALTPEQIAAYVSKQRALIAEQQKITVADQNQPQNTTAQSTNNETKIPVNRLQNIDIPPRNIQ